MFSISQYISLKARDRKGYSLSQSLTQQMATVYTLFAANNDFCMYNLW